MMTAWMLYSAVAGLLVAGSALLLHALRKGSGAPLRWIWAGAMVLTVALTVTAPWRGQTSVPSIDLSGVPRVTTTALPNAGSTVWQRADDLRLRTMNALLTPVRVGMTYAARAPRIMNFSAFVLWISTSSVALLLLVTMYRRAVRMRHTWSRGALLGVPVRVSPDAGPAVIGLAPPEIVVPQWLLDRTPQEQQLVLDHESSHVQARDPWLLLAACVAVALMPWNPAMWFMLARLRLAVELDCDGRVLHGGAPKRSYGQLLIELSQHRSRLTAAMPAFSHTPSHLERRLLAMTARPSRTSLPARVAAVLLAGVALLAACESALPTSAELEGMTASGATKRAAQVAGIDTLRTTYTVDGRATTKQEAEAIASGKIASINIIGGKGSKTGSTVQILTLAGLDSVKTAEGRQMMKIAGSDTFNVKLTDEIKALPQGIKIRKTGDSTTVTVDASSKARTPFNGLLIVEGVETESSRMNSISPDKIQSVEVVKGTAATARYTNPLAANGVIVITLKK